jgi:hypothetical protein
MFISMVCRRTKPRFRMIRRLVIATSVVQPRNHALAKKAQPIKAGMSAKTYAQRLAVGEY